PATPRLAASNWSKPPVDRHDIFGGRLTSAVRPFAWRTDVPPQPLPRLMSEHMPTLVNLSSFSAKTAQIGWSQKVKCGGDGRESNSARRPQQRPANSFEECGGDPAPYIPIPG